MPGAARGAASSAERSSIRVFQCCRSVRGRSKSTRPTTSSKVRAPREAKRRRTSSATKKKKWTTPSGEPEKCFRNSGSWVAMPTEQVLRWHLRSMMQPSATRDAVAIPNSSAPSSAATTTSRPVRSPPSTWTRMRSRIWFSTSTCCVSARPSSHGSPAYLMLDMGEAPVPPS